MAAFHCAASLLEMASWYWSGTSASVGLVKDGLGFVRLEGKMVLVAFMLAITFGFFFRSERRGSGVGGSLSISSSSVSVRVRTSLFFFAGGEKKADGSGSLEEGVGGDMNTVSSC